MPRAFLLLLLSAWQAPPPGSELALLTRVRQRMAENLERLPNYTCQETIERSERAPEKLLFRDRIHLEVAFIGAKEMFAWPGSANFEADFFDQLPPVGAIGTGSFGAWTGGIFVSSAPSFTYAGECISQGRRGLRYNFRVPLLSSAYKVGFGNRVAVAPFAGSLCADPETLDVMLLEVRAEEIPPPLASTSEVLHYARTRIGSTDFLLPQDDELTVTQLDGTQSRNLTRFSGCRQYTSESSISFGTDSAAASAPQKRIEELHLPAGITLDLKLETPITFDESAVGDPVVARLNHAVHAGAISIPKGATAAGRIWGLEQYDRPKKHFKIGLELSSLAAGGQRILFRARLVGPRANVGRRQESMGIGMNPDSSLTPTTETSAGLDIDDSEPRFGVFRIPGATLRLRGLHMIWETQDPASKEFGRGGQI